MGLGNGNPKAGDKGSNHNYEHRHLLALGNLISAVVSGTAGLATETTLQGVLTAVDSMRDYEVRLVVDSDTPPVTWLEVRYWDAQSGALGAPQYYLPGSSTPGAPVGALSYINPNTFLAQLVAELQALNAVDFSTETTLGALLTELQAKADLTETQPVSAASLPLPTGAATEATLLALSTLLNTSQGTLITNTNNLDVALSTRASEATLLAANALLATIDADTSALTAAKTPTSVVSTGVTNIPAGATEISVFNNGTGNATVNGTVLPAGVTRTFGFKNPTSAQIVCDGGGTEQLIIDYMA